ncbi:MAG: toll/interleukin-1 receptor domain-containing protein [Candidatus Methanoperedens sp.]|nr:toll/interleukin-1 receptor domain-containing protein [Candidatus Methanoperedens sp.]
MSEDKKRRSVFISHSSANLAAACQIDERLHAAGLDPWLDHSDIRVGALLGKELQHAIQKCKAMVLLWSKPASESRWVAAEILSAFHMNRFIIPCVLSAVELPPFLSRSVYFDFRRGRKDALTRLGDQVKHAPRKRNEFTAVSSYKDLDLKMTIASIYAQQNAIVSSDAPALSKRLQKKSDAEMHVAEKRWRYDPTILNLAGYHRKNAYMIKYWDEYCAGRFPRDTLLDEGERFFFVSLFGNPLDYGALNGLGNILYFKGELDAAAFFVGRAIACAEEAGVDYEDAKHDLALIRHRTQLR